MPHQGTANQPQTGWCLINTEAKWALFQLQWVCSVHSAPNLNKALNRGETLTPSHKAWRNTETSSSWGATKLHRAWMGESSGEASLQPCFQASQAAASQSVLGCTLVWPRITSVMCISHSPWTSRKNSLPREWCSPKASLQGWGSPSLGICRHRPYEARTSLCEERSAVSWEWAREPLSLPWCCIHAPKNMGAFSTTKSWNTTFCPASSKSLVILPSEDIFSTGLCLNSGVKTVFLAHDVQMTVSYRGKKSEGRSQFPSP